MKYGVVRTLLLLLLTLVVAVPITAQERQNKGERKKGERQIQVLASLKKQLAQVDLTQEQTAKLTKLFAEYAPKLAAAQKKVTGLLTKEQRQAQMEARKKATAEGKKRKELQAAVDAALDLPAEKLAELKKAQAESRDLGAKLRKSVQALLTPEQRKKVSLTARGKGGEAKQKKAQGGKRKKPKSGEAEG